MKMKIGLAIVLLAYAVLTTCEVTGPRSPRQGLYEAHTQQPSHISNPLHRRTVDVEAEWTKAFCKGQKLSLAMVKPEAQAANHITPVRSPWDGNLIEEFAKWGYRDISTARANVCDFSDLKRAFSELGIDTLSAEDGGQNVCYAVEHQYGPKVVMNPDGRWPEPDNQWYEVEERKLRETQAYTVAGINTHSGVLFFINRRSPLQAARESWRIPDGATVQSSWLPDLAASSDHAWGFWNQAHVGTDLSNIKYIFSCFITNEITLSLIDKALATYPLAPGETRPKGVEKWPGTEFPIYSDAALVLLGSPNGAAAGFFLAQHKHKLGQHKSISKVRVFRPDRGGQPYLMFHVEDASAEAAGMAREDEISRPGSRFEEMGRMSGPDRVKMVSVSVSLDGKGKNMLREHVYAY